jgi:hypothetical protein
MIAVPAGWGSAWSRLCVRPSVAGQAAHLGKVKA